MKNEVNKQWTEWEMWASIAAGRWQYNFDVRKPFVWQSTRFLSCILSTPELCHLWQTGHLQLSVKWPLHVTSDPVLNYLGLSTCISMDCHWLFLCILKHYAIHCWRTSLCFLSEVHEFNSVLSCWCWQVSIRESTLCVFIVAICPGINKMIA